jgi:uncharacterized protein YbjT (DUF2867 family)
VAKQAAIVLGASGSVGGALIDELVRDGSFDPIITLVRRARATDGVREVVVPSMEPAALEAATREAIGSLDAVGLSVLGIGAGTGKLTIEQHRAVDVELNAAFARGLKAAGVKHLAFMSAVGSDPTAKETGSGAAGGARYARVKGEAEEAVKASGLVVSIFRPAMIIGSQHTPWLLEKALPVFGFVTPKKWKSITVEQIAKAMVAASKQPPAETRVNHYPEMIELGR